MEDGSIIGSPGLPVLNNETLLAAVEEAHRYGKLAIAHVSTADLTQQVIEGGVDGLGHILFDCASTPQLVNLIAGSGAFVIPTLTVCSSAMGYSGAELASDERVRSKLSKEWLESLKASMNVYPQGNFDDVLSTVFALHNAGVEILAGTDVTDPILNLGACSRG